MKRDLKIISEMTLRKKRDFVQERILEHERNRAVREFRL